MPAVKIPKVPKSVRDRIAVGIRGVNETIDVWWQEDFKREMPEVYGQLALSQRLLRRLTCRKGFFPWWPNEGIDIRDYLLSKIPLWRIKNDVDDQCAREEQIEYANSTPSYLENNRVLNLKVDLVSGIGNFSFTMTATEAAARLIALQTTS
jgi:hypothetical protein